jgi:hypothetical protein
MHNIKFQGYKQQVHAATTYSCSGRVLPLLLLPLLSAVSILQEPACELPLPLSLVLEHPAVSTDPKVLCAAACACRAWREAVRQSSVCNTAVELHIQQGLQQMQSFAAWLSMHAQLVRTISSKIQPQQLESVTLTRCSWRQLEAMGQQVRKALRGAAAAQVARTPPAATAVSAAAAGGTAATASLARLQQQQQQRWRLASFSCDLPGAAGMLAALPAHSLTHLELDLTDSGSASLNNLPHTPGA